MKETELKKAGTPEEAELLLPLVVEIIPGQAAEGLIEVLEPGSYDGKSLKQLCDQVLAKQDWSIEEQQVLDDIQRQLDGGILLCRGRDISGPAVNYALAEETEAGEKYWYAPIRAIKPQEGG